LTGLGGEGEMEEAERGKGNVESLTASFFRGAPPEVFECWLRPRPRSRSVLFCLTCGPVSVDPEDDECFHNWKQM
jgi:hypothetical protein